MSIGAKYRESVWSAKIPVPMQPEELVFIPRAFFQNSFVDMRQPKYAGSKRDAVEYLVKRDRGLKARPIQFKKITNNLFAVTPRNARP